MSESRLLFRVVGAALGVVGLFLVVTGVVRLLDDTSGLGGPVARLVIGLVFVGAGLGVVLLGSRGAATPAPPPLEPEVETTRCPDCGTENPRSAKFCVSCRTALR